MIRGIKFQGQEWLLIGDTEGAICTPKAYRNFETSYAHLLDDGSVFQFSRQIGTREDITFGDEIKIKPSRKAIMRALSGKGFVK